MDETKLLQKGGKCGEESPVVKLSSFKIIVYIYQAFILLFHKALTLHPYSSLSSSPPPLSLSLSVVPHPVFLIRGLSLRVGDVDVFFLQSKVIYSLVRHIHYPVIISTLMQQCHLVTIAALKQSVPSIYHYCIGTVTEAVSGYHCLAKIVSPSSDHFCVDIVVTSSVEPTTKARRSNTQQTPTAKGNSK